LTSITGYGKMGSKEIV